MSNELDLLPVARYLSLKGSYIDQLGSQPESLVKEVHIRHRLNRDGANDGHHITVINHLEIASFIQHDQTDPTNSASQQKKASKRQHRETLFGIHKQAIDLFGPAAGWEKPVDLGLGQCRDGAAVSYFRVVHWPLGQELRRQLGLGFTNFHITVGFVPNDVHLYKGPASLICLQPDQQLSRKRAKLLISVASFYHHDTEFFKLLGRQCWKHGYYAEMASLTQVYVTCKEVQKNNSIYLPQA
ncbi:hypothetical protein EDC96DRAFT_527005 [Choanephora cucurbitarum]|nr:hypothetical protein EDC96DRAFT_527005 [Choanephora cucurbitarum]